MTVDGHLLAQLAWVAAKDAEAIADPYAWPPASPTDEEVREAARLRLLAARLFRRAEAAGYVESGLDLVFGGEERNPGSAPGGSDSGPSLAEESTDPMLDEDFDEEDERDDEDWLRGLA